ncbi:MAG: class I SAM-dependent methyltransferase [Candidatus Thorarchaeota archaeon]
MTRLSRKEVAALGIYDFLGYIGSFDSPYIGGLEGTLKLIDKLNIQPGSEFSVLEIGCAIGYTSCMIAERYGCQVTGIDISDILIEKAKERAESRGLTNAHFQVADAMNLPFDDDSFDAVYAVALTGLLPRKDLALKEFERVLKSGGTIGTIDLFAKDRSNAEFVDGISAAMGAMLGADVAILDINQWKSVFENTGLAQIEVEKTYEGVFENPRSRSNAAKATLKLLYHMIINGAVRRRISKLLKIRKTVSLESNDEYQHVGYLVFSGKKP